MHDAKSLFERLPQDSTRRAYVEEVENTMSKRGKQYRAAFGKIDPAHRYGAMEAVTLVKSASYAKFNESIDAAINLNVGKR